ncbi:hypothetical protein ACGFNU_49785 [Spirillospora sp. NPDC048911]|uniref:hypothetical protein n=1 Tax=Spirillospora sp. NPDC048911 TaxID=3364527 RepID=UPI00370F94AF
MSTTSTTRRRAARAGFGLAAGLALAGAAALPATAAVAATAANAADAATAATAANTVTLVSTAKVCVNDPAISQVICDAPTFKDTLGVGSSNDHTVTVQGTRFEVKVKYRVLAPASGPRTLIVSQQLIYRANGSTANSVLKPVTQPSAGVPLSTTTPFTSEFSEDINVGSGDLSTQPPHPASGSVAITGFMTSP